MSVKIFLGTIILLVFVTVTGFAYWLFPIINEFHTHMGGKPLADPRGGFTEQANAWLAFLPDNVTERAAIIAGVLVGYLLLTFMAALFAMRAKRRKLDRAEREASRLRTLNAYNVHR